MDVIERTDFSINIISKSGTTTEPAIAFRIFKEMLERNTVKQRLQSVFMRRPIRQEEH